MHKNIYKAKLSQSRGTPPKDVTIDIDLYRSYQTRYLSGELLTFNEAKHYAELHNMCKRVGIHTPSMDATYAKNTYPIKPMVATAVVVEVVEHKPQQTINVSIDNHIETYSANFVKFLNCERTEMIAPQVLNTRFARTNKFINDDLSVIKIRNRKDMVSLFEKHLPTLDPKTFIGFNNFDTHNDLYDFGNCAVCHRNKHNYTCMYCHYNNLKRCVECHDINISRSDVCQSCYPTSVPELDELIYLKYELNKMFRADSIRLTFSESMIDECLLTNVFVVIGNALHYIAIPTYITVSQLTQYLGVKFSFEADSVYLRARFRERDGVVELQKDQHIHVCLKLKGGMKNNNRPHNRYTRAQTLKDVEKDRQLREHYNNPNKYVKTNPDNKPTKPVPCLNCCSDNHVIHQCPLKSDPDTAECMRFAKDIPETPELHQQLKKYDCMVNEVVEYVYDDHLKEKIAKFVTVNKVKDLRDTITITNLPEQEIVPIAELPIPYTESNFVMNMPTNYNINDSAFDVKEDNSWMTDFENNLVAVVQQQTDRNSKEMAASTLSIFRRLKRFVGSSWVSTPRRQVWSLLGDYFDVDTTRLRYHDFVIHIGKFYTLGDNRVDLRHINDRNVPVAATDPLYFEFKIEKRARFTRTVIDVQNGIASFESLFKLLHPANTVGTIESCLLRIENSAMNIAKINVRRDGVLHDNIQLQTLNLAKHYFIHTHQHVAVFHIEGAVNLKKLTSLDTLHVVPVSLYRIILKTLLLLGILCLITSKLPMLPRNPVGPILLELLSLNLPTKIQLGSLPVQLKELELKLPDLTLEHLRSYSNMSIPNLNLNLNLYRKAKYLALENGYQMLHILNHERISYQVQLTNLMKMAYKQEIPKLLHLLRKSITLNINVPEEYIHELINLKFSLDQFLNRSKIEFSAIVPSLRRYQLQIDQLISSHYLEEKLEDIMKVISQHTNLILQDSCSKLNSLYIDTYAHLTQNYSPSLMSLKEHSQESIISILKTLNCRLKPSECQVK